MITLYCLEKVYKFADYVAINISSPNTKNLRDLQSGEYIDSLLSSIKDTQLDLASTHGYTPILIKISPDMSSEELETLSKVFYKINWMGLFVLIQLPITITHPKKEDLVGSHSLNHLHPHW